MHQAAIPSSVDVDDDAAVGALARDNPEWQIEVSADGRILFSPLTGTRTGAKEAEAVFQLSLFARRHGGMSFGSATGFRLPDRSLVGPDAAWASPERLASRRPVAGERAFWRFCPDVMIEIRSEWDLWSEQQRKIDRYVENGAAYAVAIDPDTGDRYERGEAPAGLVLDFERICDA